jgi:hypothetical protein
MALVVLGAGHRFQIGRVVIAFIFVPMMDQMPLRDRANLSLVNLDMQVLGSLTVLASFANSVPAVVIPICPPYPSMTVGKHMT